MTWYKYDGITGKLIGPIVLQIDPLETQIQGITVYMYPPNITEVEPPNFNDKYNCYFEVDDWVLYKIITVYNKSTREAIITDEKFFDSVNYTEEEPPEELYYYWDETEEDWIIDTEKKDKEDEKLDKILKKTDLIDEIIEYQDTNTITLIEKIEELEARIAVLESAST